MAKVLTTAIRREVHTREYGELTVTFTAEGVYMRQKGRRAEYLLPYGTAYFLAVKAEVDSQRAVKRAGKRR